MKKTYLVELLQKLGSKQMKELSEFVQSPFFNKNESAFKIFEYLRGEHPEFKPEKIEKQTVHKKLFPSARYNDSFMRMMIFKLTSLAEKYLVYANFKTDPFEESKFLIDTLLDLNLDSDAQKQINNVEKKLNSEKNLNGSHYKKRYELEKLKDIIYSRRFKAVTIKDKPGESLLEESNNLTYFFIISILQRYRYLLNKSFTVNTSYRLDFLPHITEFLENRGKDYLKNPLVSLLYKQILVLTDLSKENTLEEIINILTNDNILIEDEERREGLIVASNICIEKAYEGKEEFFGKIFSIYKYLVSKNLYNRVKGGYFENEMFSNIVTIGLKLNEVEWVKDFIERFYKKLAPDDMVNNYNYCCSKLYFKTRNFSKALDYISKVSYSDLHMKINVRTTALTIHYELNNIEEIFTQIENFKKYVQNDKLLSPGHRRISLNFIKVISALSKARYSSGTNLNGLKHQIESADQIPHRSWFINKIQELSNLRK